MTFFYNLIRLFHHKKLLLPIELVKKLRPVRNPIFFLGTQGGGMTIIVRMLARGNDVVRASGNKKYWFLRDEIIPMYERKFPKQLTSRFYFFEPFKKKYPKIFKHNYIYPNLEIPEEIKDIYYTRGNMSWWNYGSNKLLPYFKTKKEESPIKQSYKLVKFMRRALTIYDASRFVDKSQQLSLRIPLLEKIFKKSKPIYVAITRNPYAIIYRIANKGYITRRNIPNKEAIKMASEHYNNTYNTILEEFKSIDPKRKLIIKIEDFLIEPQKNLKKICSLTKIKFEEDMLPSSEQKMPKWESDFKKWYPLQSEINAKYLKIIPVEQRKIMDKYLDQKLLKKLGY